MTSNKELPVAERARALLKWKVTGKGKAPNPFTETNEVAEALQFCIDRGYVSQRGQTPKSLNYGVTPEGRRYALSK